MSISNKVRRSMAEGSWIRRMFEEGAILKQRYGADNVFDLSLGNPVMEPPAEFVQELKTKIPYYGIRHSVRPGVTGWAQVNYQYGSSFEDALIKLEYEIYYIKNMSLILDIKILLKTIGVIILGQGAR